VTTFDLRGLKEEQKELEGRMSRPDFWDDPDEARRVSQRADEVKELRTTYESLAETLDDLEAMVELAEAEDSGDFDRELREGLRRADAVVRTLRRRHLLSGEYDDRNAILSINPGAGGTEAHDWAEMLFRMYRRWCEGHDVEFDVLNVTPGEEAGIKNATLLVKNNHAYGRLKGESGVHRLVRISPYDASNRRHTSFAAVRVTPEIDFADEVDIDENELTIDTFKASGPGGQHVNVTDSAVRITHEPTGITVSCQNERSQHKNRATAMRILRSRLLEHRIQEQKENIQEITGDEKQIEWGNQIRSYVNHPYQKVKDHRTDVEINDFETVLDGELDPFIDAYLSHDREAVESG